MGAQAWAKFEKECPFAKVLQKNYGTSDLPSRARTQLQQNPLRMYSRSSEADKSKVHESVIEPVSAPLKAAKSPARPGTFLENLLEVFGCLVE